MLASFPELSYIKSVTQLYPTEVAMTAAPTSKPTVAVETGPQQLTSDGGVIKRTTYQIPGTSKTPQRGDKVVAHYTGTLLDGSKVRSQLSPCTRSHTHSNSSTPRETEVLPSASH